MKLTVPGDTVELGFGADDKVKVTRVPLRRRENEPSWIGQTKTDLREFKTTVKNLHAQPIRITVVDRLPFSENAAIQIEQLRETTPLTEQQSATSAASWPGALTMRPASRRRSASPTG